MAPKRTFDEPKECSSYKKPKTVSATEDVLDMLKNTNMMFLSHFYKDLHNAAKTRNLTAVKNFLDAGIKIDTKK